MPHLHLLCSLLKYIYGVRRRRFVDAYCLCLSLPTFSKHYKNNRAIIIQSSLVNKQASVCVCVFLTSNFVSTQRSFESTFILEDVIFF